MTIDTTTLQTRLDEAETALHDLMLGKTYVRIEYDGYRTILKPTDQGKLESYIHRLKSSLGLVKPRRAHRVTF